MSKFFDDTMEGLLEAAAIEYKKKEAVKKPIIKRIYEDDDWVIDLIDGNIRVSYFERNHFIDEILLTKNSFKE